MAPCPPYAAIPAMMIMKLVSTPTSDGSNISVVFSAMINSTRNVTRVVTFGAC